MCRFSAPVSRSSTAAYWPVREIRPWSLLLSRRTSRPRTRADPESNGVSVDRMLTRVVLPAPLGPSSAWTPGGSVRSRPRRRHDAGGGEVPRLHHDVALPVRLRQGGPRRSEEHTSELQSREKLVCRLLLEKK